MMGGRGLSQCDETLACFDELDAEHSGHSTEASHAEEGG
jgi:hypothetical protein